MYIKGFTLIELVIVIAILGVLISIAMPSLFGLVELAELRVCEANRDSVEKAYLSLIQENDDHREPDFGQFLIENFQEVCPGGGVISILEEEISCSIHSGNDSEDPPGEEVPWL